MAKLLRSNGLSVVALAACVALSVCADSLRTSGHESYQSAQRYEDIYYLPPPSALRWVSLGWDEAAADLIWIRALVYFGDEMRDRGDIEHVFEYGEAIITLDPEFRRAYQWVGMAGMYRPQAVGVADIERSVEFLIRGAERFPTDGELAWDVGAALVYELPGFTQDEAERDRARARGLPYLMRATRLGAAPAWAALSNAGALHRLGQDEQAARHLEEMYLSVDDPNTRRRIEERITELRQRAGARAFLETMRELDRNRRSDFPYVDPALYLQLGRRHADDIAATTRSGWTAAVAADASGPTELPPSARP